MMRITGGQQIAAALRQMTARASRRAMVDALKAGAEPIRARASANAPRAPGAPDLAENIVTSVGGGSDGEEAGIAVGPAKRDFFYGYFQEFGTQHHAAQPFLRPAFDTEAERALQTIMRELWLKIRPQTGGSGSGLR